MVAQGCNLHPGELRANGKMPSQRKAVNLPTPICNPAQGQDGIAWSKRPSTESNSWNDR